MFFTISLSRYELAQIMGHSDISVADQYYIDTDQEMTESARVKIQQRANARKEENTPLALGNVEAAHDLVESAGRDFLNMVDLDPDRESPLTQFAEMRLRFAMISEAMQKNIRGAEKNAKQMLGLDYREDFFVETWNEVFVYKKWPQKKYEKNARYETYLLASARLPLNKLDGMTLRERESYIRGLIDFMT